MWAGVTLGLPNKTRVLGHLFRIIRDEISGDILAIGSPFYLQAQEIWMG